MLILAPLPVPEPRERRPQVVAGAERSRLGSVVWATDWTLRNDREQRRRDDEEVALARRRAGIAAPLAQRSRP